MQLLNGIIAVMPAFLLDAAPSEITSARARSLVWVAVALISVIVAVIGRLRSSGRMGSASSIIAIGLGAVAAVMGIIHIAASTGFGTGGGRAGAIIALVLAIVGIGLGAITLLRTRSSQTV
jgi:hypothetical protein